jgi:hypothetical protein
VTRRISRSFGCYMSLTKHAVCGRIYLDSGLMEYININYNSVSFSYRDCRGTCAHVIQGSGAWVMWGGLCGGHAGYIPIGKLRSTRLPFCPHCRISNNYAHLPTNGLIVPPQKKHWCVFVSFLRGRIDMRPPEAVVSPLMPSSIVQNKDLALLSSINYRHFLE